RSDKIEVDWDDKDSDVVDSSSEEDERKLGQTAEAAPKETAEQKRVRVAKELLDKIQKGGLGTLAEQHDENDEAASDASDDAGAAFGATPKLDPVSQQLHQNILRSEGRLRKPTADKFDSSKLVHQQCATRAHRLSVTCAALSDAEDVAFTGSKDCSIVRWDVETGKRVTTLPGQPATKSVKRSAITGHWDEVLSVALSSDGRYLASGGRDRFVRVWDTRTNELVDSFKGHRGAVSGVAFQKGTHRLYSASHDRSVRAWDVDEMAYVESLFGHQAELNGIDCLYRERAVTCSADRTVRFWKIPEESQLLLQGHHTASIDCVRMLDEVHFLSGSQESSLALWHTSKKKPCSLVRNAHGSTWITAVAVMPNSDLCASGASDGQIKFWKADLEGRRLHAPSLGQFAIPGFVNALCIGASGRVVVAGTGQEHRLGRWQRLAGAKNTLHILRLPEED
ncbi:U3 small nucleolar RNA-interacting protein 2 (RRP9 homolog) (U3 small nucleolar ribonucleoprotein-associated 55 kDa protein) (U3 snoRNP-associated 55 kDa protein) (U3-55K), partial [Durusdinium trenchii]